mgnify:CR=1 FL=1
MKRRSRARSVGLLVAVLLGSRIVAQPAPAPAPSDLPAAYDPLLLSALQPADPLDLTVTDASRARDIPIRVYLPAVTNPAPVVLFSHGLGGNRQGCAYLGRHWAARGYVVVFLQHPGSDDGVWRGQPRREINRAMRDAASGANFLLRVKDVPAVLDRLARWQVAANHPLAGRLDLKRVGMSGHSFGAITTQAVSGQSAPGGGQPFTDRRIKAAIAFSPSEPRVGSPAQAFGQVAIPWLLMTGTKDVARLAGAAIGAVAIWPEAPDNVALDEEFGDRDAVNAAFASADLVVEIDVRNQRIVNAQMEPRSAIGAYDPASDNYTVISGGQGPHRPRQVLAASFSLPEAKLRFINPDTGGGFGPRNNLYPEQAAVAWAARRVGRPVKWTSDRSEAFLTDYQGRDMVTRARLALARDGRMLAIALDHIGAVGGQTVTYVPLSNAYRVATTVYDIPHLYMRCRAVMTNTVPIAPFRGAGRPEATLVIERLIDTAAARLGIDRVELREICLNVGREGGWKRRLVFAADDKAQQRRSIHEMIRRTISADGISLSQVTVSAAKFRLIFTPVDNQRPKRLTFRVSSPDNCSLRDNHHDQIARKCLHRWKLTVDGLAATAPAGGRPTR